MSHLRDRVAVVTGGSSGIGLAIASSLVAEGMSVAICARNIKRLRQAAKTLEKSGGYVATPMVHRASVPHKEMIPPEDIGKLVVGLLHLSPHTVIKEIVIERTGANGS